MILDTISIIGLGMIGSSLAHDLKKSGFKVKGYARHPQTITKAYELGIIDSGTSTLADVLTTSQLIIIATPLNSIFPLLEEIDKTVSYTVIVSDVGSVKGYLCKKVEEAQFKHVCFLGGHPMAGSEKTGINAMIPGLFKDKPYILTPAATTPLTAKQLLQDMILALGAHCYLMKPDEHDAIVGAVSHLPYMLASSLMRVIKAHNKTNPMTTQMAASGLRDTTRVASSCAVWGTDIAIQNKEVIINLLRSYEKELQTLMQLLEQGNDEYLYHYFHTNKQFRNGVFKND